MDDDARLCVGSSVEKKQTTELPTFPLLVPFVVLAALPWLRFRFTLRTLLIATMLVAIVLGLIVAVI